MENTKDKNTYEYCNECGCEVELENTFKVQKCPNCEHYIVPCNLCPMTDCVGSIKCPLSILSDILERENEEVITKEKEFIKYAKQRANESKGTDYEWDFDNEIEFLYLIRQHPKHNIKNKSSWEDIIDWYEDNLEI